MAPKVESKAKPRRRRNPELAAQHVAPQGIPASRFNLTPRVRVLLPDRGWVTEDDADAIIGLRREREPGRRYSLEEVLRENGSDQLDAKRCQALD
jgi:hypothetical protein